MTPRQRVVVVMVAIAMMVIIVELIRRRRLREEYSVLWMMLGTTALLLTASDGVRARVAGVLGIEASGTAVAFLFGLFMCLIALHFTVKISALTQQVKDLAQEVALLRAGEGEGPARPGEAEA